MCIRDRVQGGWSRFWDEWQKSIVIKIFNISRDYEDLISVLGVEQAVHIMTVGDLVDDDEAVDSDKVIGDNDGIIGSMLGSSGTYLLISNPDDEKTVADWYKTHDADSYWFEKCNQNYDYYNLVDDDTNLNECCSEKGKIIEVDNNEMCTYNIRLIYDGLSHHRSVATSVNISYKPPCISEYVCRNRSQVWICRCS